MKIIYGKAGVKDIPELLKLAEIFEKEHYANVIKNNPEIEEVLKRKRDWLKEMKKFFRSCIYSKNAVVYTARHNGNIVGYSLLITKKNIPVFKIDRYGYFGDLFVLKEYRGIGISTELKNIGLRWFKQKGMEYAYIGVHFGNEKARKIYRKWGFVPRHIEMVKKI